VRHRGLLSAAPVLCLAALVPATAAAASGATLTVPAQVQASPGVSPKLQPVFSYPESTPFCTVGVDFTWDGGSWLSALPIKNGTLCVVSGLSAAVPSGHDGAGAHQVCGSAGPQYRDCKTVTVVLVAASPGGPAPRSTASNPTTLPPLVIHSPSAVPAGTPDAGSLANAVQSLPASSRAGLILLAVGVAGLLALLVRRLALRLVRRRRTPLPSPDDPR